MNEKLIEEAAKRLLKDVNPKHGRPVSSQLASDIRLVAGAVFEKALTPTDDEVEALTLIVRDVHNMASDSSVETWVCGKCGGNAYEHSLTTSTCIWEPIETHPAPQSEPSDAQVNRDYLAQVIHKAVYSRIPLDDLTDEAQADTYKRAAAVVAALRATGEVRS